MSVITWFFELIIQQQIQYNQKERRDKFNPRVLPLESQYELDDILKQKVSQLIKLHMPSN